MSDVLLEQRGLNRRWGSAEERRARNVTTRKRWLSTPNGKSYKRRRGKIDSARKRRWISQLKFSSGCYFCKENHPDALDFHHKDPDTKLFGLRTVVSHGLAAVKKEIEKCVLLCANCHRKVHYREKRSGERFPWDVVGRGDMDSLNTLSEYFPEGVSSLDGFYDNVTVPDCAPSDNQEDSNEQVKTIE